MSNHTCPFLKNVALAAVCCMGTGLFAAATDGTWNQPLNDNYSMSTGQYWLHAAVANGGYASGVSVTIAGGEITGEVVALKENGAANIGAVQKTGSVTPAIPTAPRIMLSRAPNPEDAFLLSRYERTVLAGFARSYGSALTVR